MPATEALLVERDATRKKPSKIHVAEQDGQVIGFSRCDRWHSERPVRYVLSVAIEPEYRRSGLGGELYARAETSACELGATQLWLQHVETNDVGARFAAARGYTNSFTLHELFLDPVTWTSDLEDPAPKLQSEGISLTRYGDFEDSPDNRRNLYDIVMAAEQDVPHFGADERPEFESWEKTFIQSSRFQPDTIGVALDGAEWVGVGAIGEFAPGIYMNTITGVRRSHRKRNIALALKLQGIHLLKEKGVRELRTQNHGTNEAMLGLNVKLGFKRMPSWQFLERTLEQPSNVE
jgi:GNAT superfamily N-acetyltransferase